MTPMLLAVPPRGGLPAHVLNVACRGLLYLL